MVMTSLCSCNDCKRRQESKNTEESVGFVLVKYYWDSWNNYKFFQRAKHLGDYGNWMDDPLEATVFTNAYAEREVSNIQLICDPRFQYKFVPVNVRSTKVVSWKRSYIAQANTY